MTNNLSKIKQESEEEYEKLLGITPQNSHLFELSKKEEKTKKFLLSKLDLAYEAGRDDGSGEIIKNSAGFIETTMLPEKAIEEARLAERKEIAGKISAMKKDILVYEKNGKEWFSGEKSDGYNSALQEVLKLLKE